MKPNFFIVGAPKCGTTSMSEYLKQHPEIFISDPKEPLYFGKDLEHSWRMSSLDHYLDLFKGVKNEKVIGESTVWYLYSKTAAKEIKEFNSNSKIIIMLRNPVEMIFSLHGQFLFSSNENIKDFEKALAIEDLRKRNMKIPEFSHFPKGLLYTSVASYSLQVKRFIDVFGYDNVHVILFDDFIKKTQDVYKDTLEFLGVNSEFLPEFKIHNQARNVKSIWIRDLPKNLVVQRISNSLLSTGMKKKLGAIISGLNVKENADRKMKDDTIISLQNHFRDDIKQLAQYLNRDLNHWLEN